MKPKTVKSFLQKCLDVAHSNRDDLKGIEKLSQEDYSRLGDLRAGLQNDLGEMEDILKKYKLKYGDDF